MSVGSFPLFVSLLALVALGCSESNPVDAPWDTDGPLPANGIVFVQNQPADGWSLDWISPGGSGRQTIIAPFWSVMSAPRGGKIAAEKSGLVTADYVDDSLFVIDMASRKLTFIASLLSNFVNGMAVSPDGSRVAYASGWDREVGGGTLRIANVDGSDNRVLASQVRPETPAFSPDGRSIAYVENDYRSEKLRIVDIESGSVVLVADSVHTFGAGPLSWSPDGRQLVFCRRAKTDSITVWITNIDGTGKLQLTPEQTQEMQPQWSPDGKQIAFSTGGWGSDREIAVVNADGSGRQVLTNTSKIVNDVPRWSPDGTRLLYRTYGDPSSETLLKLYDLRSGAVTVLTSNAGGGFWDLTVR